MNFSFSRKRRSDSFILGLISEQVEIVMSQLDTLTAQVAANNTVVESAITLIGGLKTSLDAAIAALPNDNGAALQALSDSLGSEDSKLAAAIAANTPVASTPPTDTPPAPAAA